MRVRHLTAALTLSALALTGCSGETDAEGTSTSTSTVKPTVVDPTSSSTSPESSTSSTSEAETDGPPPEARANTKEGAEAFAKWYWEESGDALTDGDTMALREASSPECSICEKANDVTDKDAKEWGLVKDNPYDVSVVRSAQDERGVWRVKLKVVYGDYIYEQAGKPIKGVRSNSYEVNPELERTDESWLVRDWLVVR